MKVRAYVAVLSDGSFMVVGGKNASARKSFLPEGVKEVGPEEIAEIMDGLSDYQLHVVEAEVPDFISPPAIQGTLVAG